MLPFAFLPLSKNGVEPSAHSAGDKLRLGVYKNPKHRIPL